MGEGMIDFLACGRAGALVKFTVEDGIKLEEVETLHVEPLVEEARDEFIRAGISNQTIHLLTKDLRIRKLIATGKVEQFPVGRSTPEEIGQAHRKLAIIELAAFGTIGWLVEIEKAGRGEDDAKRQFDGVLK